uniref:Importin N-terminal domain-containing protein n=1 Tax=Arcella intermedia TaxID=1963864 RepID=A0A6B2KX71_9EUKA
MKGSPGFVATLFKLVGANDAPLDVRQAATILFKNLVHKRWHESEEDPLSDEEKAFVRSNLLQVLCMAPRLIEVQLGQVLFDVLKMDYPDKWPNLIPDLMQLISSQDPAKIRGALFCLHIIAKRFEYTSTLVEHKRTQFYLIIESTFPVLLKLFEYLAGQPMTEISMEMELLIIKIFWSSTQFGMAPSLLVEANFQPWINLFVFVLNRPVPTVAASLDAKERAKLLPWKQKAVISKIFERYVERFASPRKHDNQINIAFSKIFMDKYIIKLLETNINFLKNFGGGRFKLPSKLTTNLINYLNGCVFYAQTWKLIKPNLDMLLNSIIYPILYFGEEDLRVFQEDPQEFIRLEVDINIEISSPKSSVLGFLGNIVKVRGNEFLDYFMGFFNTLITRYQSTSIEHRSLADKYTAILAIGHFSYVLLKSEKHKPSLEEFLTNHVFPELLSPHAFLKARAIWVFGRFYSLKFKNENNYLQAIQIVINSLTDKCLPINIFSAIALQQFLKTKAVRPMIEKIVPQLIETLLNLMNQIDSDDLVGALKTLIENFGTQIQELIPNITAKLVEQYQKLLSKGDELFDEDDQAGLLAAMEYLQAIITILDNVKSEPTIMSKVEPILLPVLYNVSPSIVDLFSDYIQIITYLTYFGNISDGLWKLFEMLTDIYFSWGNDYLEDFLAPFDNFISRGTDRFLSGPPGNAAFETGYLGRICKIFQMAIEDVNGGNSNAVSACALMEVVLVYCRGRVDPIVPTIIELILKRLKLTDSPYLTVSLLELLANTLYYNPLLALKTLEKHNAITDVFNCFISSLQHFKRRHEIKVVILGLSAILYVPLAQWPSTLRPFAKSMVVLSMNLCKKYANFKTHQAHSDSPSEESGMEDEEFDEDSDLDPEALGLTTEEFKSIKKDLENLNRPYGDDEDVAPDVMSGAIMNKLAELYADEESEDSVEEGDFSSKIDEVDELLFFLQAFRNLETQEVVAYHELLATFTTEEQDTLKELANKANEKATTVNDKDKAL